MAIEAKATFLSELERTFSPVMTAEMMEKTLSMISDTLNRYSLDVIEEPCSDKDDLFNAYIDAMAVQGRSEKTIERYRYIIQRLMASVKVPTRKSVGSQTERWRARVRCSLRISTGCIAKG